MKTNKSMPMIAFWYLLGNLFVRGLGVITTPIFSRILTKEEYGSFNNFTSWESILLVIVTLDLSTSISRAKYDYNEKISEFISSITLFSTFFTCIVYIIIEWNMQYFCNLFSMAPFYIRLLFIYLLFEPAYEYMQSKHRMYMKYKFFLFFSISSAIFRTGVSVILVYLMEDKLLGRVIGYIVPASCMYFIIYCYILLKGRSIKWSYCKYALSIGIPLIPHTLSANLLASSDKIMITNFCGGEQTALYSLAYTVASIVTLIRASINRAWTPWFFDKLNNCDYSTIRKHSKYYVDIFLFLSIGIMLTAPELVFVLGGKQYYEVCYIIPPIMCGTVCEFIYTLYVNIEIYNKKTGMISLGTILAAIFNIILNLIFIPEYGYMAAAYTTLMGYMALAVFHFLLVDNRLNMSFVFNNSSIFMKLGVCTAIQLIGILLYHIDYLRYLCILLYAGILIALCVKHKDIIVKVCKGK